jgi:hypothetical protein
MKVYFINDFILYTCRAKLHGLFGLIEKEFEGLYMENVSLTEKLELMTERMERESICTVTDRYRSPCRAA